MTPELIHWLQHGERGLSSETMAEALSDPHFIHWHATTEHPENARVVTENHLHRVVS